MEYKACIAIVQNMTTLGVLLLISAIKDKHHKDKQTSPADNTELDSNISKINQSNVILH